MTVFAPSNLPSSVTTLEELIYWATLALRECAPTQAYAEAVNVVNFQVDVQESVSPDGKPIVVCRHVFEAIQPSAVVGKRWNAVIEIPRSAGIPSYYTSN